MKLVENPIRLNASLHKMLPYTVRYLYGKSAVKTFRLYTLGSVHVHYIEGFKSIDVVMTHEKRNIRQDEIDFVIGKLFADTETAQLTVNHAAKDEIEGQVHHKIGVHDLVIISLPVAHSAA
ncbi:DUF1827 family protein [Lacticaseibacillus mingshuiensis]|uniref:DUF1827 family protein n=1 Tax=Lacticaseibacillus mingshuiensis TaxID=2799574 RepID=UPI001950C18B|nr:DUF1827 family protein [Lacticaseibacillus mingshuiensis]